jgi:hypothetical protein
MMKNTFSHHQYFKPKATQGSLGRIFGGSSSRNELKENKRLGALFELKSIRGAIPRKSRQLMKMYGKLNLDRDDSQNRCRSTLRRQRIRPSQAEGVFHCT